MQTKNIVKSEKCQHKSQERKKVIGHLTNKFGDLGKNNRKYQEGKGGIGYLTIKFAGRVMIGQRRKKMQ